MTLAKLMKISLKDPAHRTEHEAHVLKMNEYLLGPIFHANNDDRSDPWSMTIEQLEAWKVLVIDEKITARHDPSRENRKYIRERCNEVLMTIRMALAEKKAA